MSNMLQTGLEPHADEDVQEDFPCSATQERFWFLDQLKPGDPSLSVALLWDVIGTVSTADLEDAFRHVIARHEILRTRFVEMDGYPRQVIDDDVRFVLSEIDLRAIAPDLQAARVKEIACEDAAAPFDLERGPLIRATLIRLDRSTARLAIAVHHICFDGWSIGVLGREIALAAKAIADGNLAADTLPPLALQFADYSLWEQEYLASAQFGDVGAYWKKTLAGAPYFEITPDYPRPIRRTSSCSSVYADFPVSFVERVAHAAKRSGCSQFAFGAAALSAMLARLTGSQEVTFSTPVAGRLDVELEDLIGVFINTVILRIPVSEADSGGAHIDHASSVIREGLAHQRIPFNKLVEQINPVRDPSRIPLASINYILQDAFMKPVDGGTFEMKSAPSHAPGALYDLNFMIVGRPTGWRMTIEYNTDLFKEETADRLLALWQSAFAFLLDDVERPLSDLALPISGLAAHDEDDAGDALTSALRSHALVDDAAVVSYADSADALRWYGFVTASQQATIALETLPSILMTDVSGTGDCVVPDGISVLRTIPRDGRGQLMPAHLPQPTNVSNPNRSSPVAKEASEPRLRAIESELAAIWTSVLGVEGINANSDFFALGGHSLLTVRMLAAVERAFGYRPDLAALYRDATLRTLAQTIATTGQVQAEPVSTVTDHFQIIEHRATGKGVPVIGLNCMALPRALANSAGGDRRIVSICFFDPRPDHALKSLTLEEIAVLYVEQINKALPEGPCVLLGECVHGVLAFEVALKLRQMGREVRRLAAVNMWHPTFGSRLSRIQRYGLTFRAIRDNLGLVRSGEKTFLQFLGNYRLAHGSGIFKVLLALGLIDAIPPRVGTAEQVEFILSLSRARDRYRPIAIDGPILQMLTPDTPSGLGSDPSLGWADVPNGGLDVVRVRRFFDADGTQSTLPSIIDTLADALDAEDRANTPKVSQ